MYRAYLMRDQVGQRFEGTISAVTNFGAFVEIEEPYVEGLIKLDTLGDEPWDFDAVHMRLTGRKTGKMIELGDKVQVEINNVSVIRRRIDFTLLGVLRTGKKPVTHGKRGALQAEGKAGFAQQRKAGRELAKAAQKHAERGAAPRRERGGGGKMQLGVSHRGMSERAGGGGGGGKRGKPHKKRR
jgi:ribonuclease R